MPIKRNTFHNNFTVFSMFTSLNYYSKLTEIANCNQVLQCHWHNEKRTDSQCNSCTTTIAFVMIDHITYMYALTAHG